MMTESEDFLDGVTTDANEVTNNTNEIRNETDFEEKALNLITFDPKNGKFFNTFSFYKI